MRSRTTQGFTLLEIILSLGLSVVLMALVNSAFQFYTRDMDVSKMDIRQTVLASRILQMIEDDLRATIHGEPADMKALEALLASTGGGDIAAAAGAAGDGEDLSAAGVDSGSEDPESDIALEEEESVVTNDLTSGVAILETPGLIGNQFQIQVDVSRLPRLEEYISLLSEDNSDIQDVPSDIKTVTYYVQPAGAGVEDVLATDQTVTSTETTGLVRRSLDRAATTFAVENGNFSTLSQTGDVIAPEVVDLQFEYFDGVNWQIEWSSDTYEELPLAIRISLSMINPDLPADADQESAVRTFTHIVRLPMAKLIEEEETEEEDELSEAGV